MKSASKQKNGPAVGYVAFLRGINVGGNKQIKMEELRKSFEALGFHNIKTVLASGNIVFDAVKTGADALAGEIAARLKSDLGHEIGVLVRSVEELERLARAQPFKAIKVTPQTRLYVSFLSPNSKGGALKAPYQSPKKDFRVLSVSASEVCSALTLSATTQTTDLMAFLEKEFGKSLTTRNWNTVAKILDAVAKEK